jgi:hypothetical protein|tara:strand:+ start:1388 stop:1780 length:393 start_codon:yes stop_codon:yes gene_type:complete
MPKKPKRSTVVKKLDAIFSQYIRKRNSDNGKAVCFTCGKVDDWQNLQCGHFQSRRHYSTRWDDLNCQVQCAKCNIFSYGEQYKFGVFLNAKFGRATASKLHVKAQKQVKFQTYELQDMIKKYQELVDNLN